MNEPERYVLKKPLEIPTEIDKSYSVHLDLETFFRPLDVEATRDAIDSVVHEVLEDVSSGEIDWPFKRDVAKLVAERVLIVLGISVSKENE